MYVTSLRPRGRDADTWTLTIEGGGTRRLLIDAETVAELRLHRGVEVDQTLFAQLLPIDSRVRTRVAALTLLRYRLRSSSELASRLRRRGFPGDLVTVVVDELTTQGLVDDERFARVWATTSAAAGRGPHRIAAELRLKGISRQLADEVSRQVWTPETEITVALDLLSRRMSRLKGLPKEAQQRRMVGLLRRRGFSGDTITDLLRHRWPGGDQNGGTEDPIMPRQGS